MNKLFLLFTFHLVYCAKDHFTIADNGKTSVSKCVNKIMLKYFEDGMLMQMIDNDLRVTYPVMRYNTLSANKFRPMIFFPDLYVIQLKEKNVTKMLQVLEIFPGLNTGAKFIILTKRTEDFNQVFSELPKFFIYQAIVISEECQAATFDPYEYEDVRAVGAKPKIFDRCENAEFRRNLPKLWRNTTVEAMNSGVANMIYFARNGFKKFGLEIFKLLKEKIGFQLKHTKNPNYKDHLRARETHVSSTIESLIPEQIYIYDFLSLYIEVTQQWVVSKAKFMPYWKSLYLSFTPFIWFFILISFAAVCAALHLAEQSDFVSCLQFFYQMLLEVSIPGMNRIRRIGSRVLVFTTVSSFLVISTLFKSKMVKIFFSRPYEHQINSVQDIIDSKVSCSLFDGYKKYFENEPIFDVCTFFGGVNAYPVMDTLLRKRNFATILRSDYYKYFLYSCYEDGNVLQALSTYLIPKVVFFNYRYLLLTKGYPLRFRFREIVDRLRNGGIIQYLMSESFYHLDRIFKQKKNSHNFSLINSEQVSAAFYILVTGMILSTVMLLLEIFVYRLKHQKRNTSN